MNYILHSKSKKACNLDVILSKWKWVACNYCKKKNLDYPNLTKSHLNEHFKTCLIDDWMISFYFMLADTSKEKEKKKRKITE